MWDVWLTKWQWGRFSSSTSVSAANSHSTNCSILINHPLIDPIVPVQAASLNNTRKYYDDDDDDDNNNEVPVLN
jgi:hypothetical protein